MNEQNGHRNLTEQIKSKEAELAELLECEEMWWGQRARTMATTLGQKH
jgi:hypothetical protein